MHTYYLNRLRLTGESVPNAEILFKTGANVIVGPSNTGKTFVFQCLNYMLGSSRLPKSINEASNYSNIYLEIITIQGVAYTLKSDLKGGEFELYKNLIDDISFDESPEILSRKHSPNSENTISAFFLKLGNIHKKRIRTNLTGKTRELSYRDLSNFIMVNEERIITEDSPIVTHYTKSTEEKNVLKLILTGKDDSEIIAKLNAKEVSNKKGRLEVVQELVHEATSQIAKLEKAVSTTSLSEVNERIEKLQRIQSDIKNEYEELSLERSSLLKKKEEIGRQKRELIELQKRSGILDSHYTTDKHRLKSTIEACVLLLDDKSEEKICPLCQSNLPHSCENEDINKIIESCQAEFKKIDHLQIELKSSQTLIIKETEVLEETLGKLDISIDLIQKKISQSLKNQLTETLRSIDSLINDKSALMTLEYRKAQLAELSDQRDSLAITIDNTKESNVYDSLSAAIMYDLCKKLQEFLEGINYPQLSAVGFSEDKTDFVISGQNRSLFGKGYRAIIYASFIISLQEYVGLKDYYIGVPVLDSPLVTYRKPNVPPTEETIPTDLAMDFYRSIANSRLINQVIIIENEPPPSDITDDINYIEFTGNKSSGRYGFIPQN